MFRRTSQKLYRGAEKSVFPQQHPETLDEQGTNGDYETLKRFTLGPGSATTIHFERRSKNKQESTQSKRQRQLLGQTRPKNEYFRGTFASCSLMKLESPLRPGTTVIEGLTRSTRPRTVSGGTSMPRFPRPRMMPSAAARISSKLRRP